MLGHRPLNVEDYLTILKRRWWIIAIPAIILPIVAVAITFFIPAQYTSQTLVLIDQQKVPDDFVKPVVTEDLNSRLASMKEQIESRSGLQPIIEKYNLYASDHLDMDTRISRVRKDITIDVIQSEIRSNGMPGFKISFTASDPHTAQQVCQEITSLFISANLRGREDAAKGTTSFLDEQLQNAKHELDDQDAKLADFQRKYVGMLPEDEAGNTNMLNTLTSQLDAATQQIQSVEQAKGMLETMLTQQTQAAAASPGGVVHSPAAEEVQLEKLQSRLADLQTQYSDEYPDVKSVKRQIADLQKQMAKESSAPAVKSPVQAQGNRPEPMAVQELRARIHGYDLQIGNLRRRQEDYQRQIAIYQSRIQSSPEVEALSKQLTRDHQSAVDYYTQLQMQSQKAKEATDLEIRQQGETFNLLDSANLPDSPTFPKRSVFAMAGVALGLALGLGIVALLEYRDTALRSERDVWAFVQLPTLAVIAWSGEMARTDTPKRGLLKRLFGRKTDKKLLADATG